MPLLKAERIYGQRVYSQGDIDATSLYARTISSNSSLPVSKQQHVSEQRHFFCIVVGSISIDPIPACGSA